jgi:hypothetical protein
MAYPSIFIFLSLNVDALPSTPTAAVGAKTAPGKRFMINFTLRLVW